MKINTFILVCLSFSTLAQDGLTVQLSSLGGTSISHASGRTVPEKLHTGLSLDISKMTFGKKYWQSDHGFPQMGLLLSFQSLGNAKVYGDAIALVPYLEFNVYCFKVGVFQLKHGTGLAWVTKTFDTDHNDENILHSTNLNASSILDGGFRFNINNQSDFKIGGILRHISNGGFLKPNAGSNTASVYFNYTRYIREKPGERFFHTRVPDFDRWLLRLMLSSGIYRRSAGKDLTFVPQLSAVTFYQHNTSFRTGAGLEAGIPYNIKPQLAVYLEEELQFSHMVTRYGLGGYVLNRNERDNLYTKIGIAWYPKIKDHIPSGFFAGFILKAHNFKAAHVEVNTGYTF